jgi:putative hydrolase of the HAD superfamily
LKKYKHIYFDLDRTIWDFDGNSYQTLKEILEKFDFTVSNSNDFYITYQYFNEQYWKMFREGKVSKEKLRLERFIKTLDKFGIRDIALAEKISDDYIRIGPTKTGLIPHAREILEELSEEYSLYIITNGFIDIQENKLRNSGVSQYFKKIFTSEHAKSSKPNRGIFEFALKSVNARKKESLMVGDDYEVDILGAREFGIDQVYYNPVNLKHEVNATFEIRSLIELREIL